MVFTCSVQYAECEMQRWAFRAQCEVWSLQCEVQSLQSNGACRVRRQACGMSSLHLACGVWRLVGGVCMAWTDRKLMDGKMGQYAMERQIDRQIAIGKETLRHRDIQTQRHSHSQIDGGKDRDRQIQIDRLLDRSKQIHIDAD